MLTKIRLKNFQAHADTILDLVPGINAIVGKSDSGKSAILRGLYWLNNNRPGGTGMVSFWNRNKAGEPKEETSVQVDIDGVQIKRLRTKEVNGYQIGDAKPLEAVRSDVPGEVSSLLNMGEVNIQKQMDAPFLLSETSGEVARFFNRIIKLDSIDTILAKIESDKRKSRDQALVQEELANIALKSLEGFAFLDEATSLVNKATRVSDRIQESKKRLAQITQGMNTHKEITARRERTSNLLSSISGPLNKAIAIDESIKSMTESQGRLKRSLLEYRKIKETLDTLAILPKATALITQAQEAQALLLAKGEKIRQINSKLFALEDLVKKNSNFLADLVALSSEVATNPICPTCGQPIIGDHE